MKLLVLFYSTSGHVFQLANAIVEGARQVAGAQVFLKRVPETLSPEVIVAMGATTAQASFAHIPVATVEDLAEVDAIIFGTPTPRHDHRRAALCLPRADAHR